MGYSRPGWNRPFNRIKNLGSHRRAKIFAYLSIGEAEPYRAYFNKIRKEWIIGENKFWNSYIVDLRAQEYQDLLLEIMEEIGKKGYDGLFLDTFDSYQMALDQREWESYELAEINLIRRAKAAYPHLMLIPNRSFEILEHIRDYINGFLFEGLFSKIDFETDSYVPVSEEERKWLLAKLEPARSVDIPIVVVDYVSLSDREKVSELIRRIRSFGFIPYISEKELNVIGVSPCRP